MGTKIRYAGECDCEAEGLIEPGEECEHDATLPTRTTQEQKDYRAYSLLMEIIQLAKGGHDYKPALKELRKIIKDSPAATELVKQCIRAMDRP